MKNKEVDRYVDTQKDFAKEICERLRKIIFTCDANINETLKWGSPAYEKNGLVCWFWSAKSFVSLTFYYGSVIEDKYKLFNSGRNNLKNRSIKFFKVTDVNEKKLEYYIKKAIQNNLEGIRPKIISIKRKNQVLPAFIKNELVKQKVYESYTQRPPYQQRDYISWIERAKQAGTKLRRLQIMVTDLKTGIYMNDKYKG